MAKNLVIVESPAKAKTIEKFLGKDYIVKSSFGHVRDLSKSTFNHMGIDTQNGFLPVYEISIEKRSIVKELTSLSKKADMVWLASDEDREGEAISWHLLQALNLDEKKTKRIAFHEITKDAIVNAIQNPRSIDINLVDAQQARRILDRLVGFEVSPILWKKVKPSLSAGRVQSVAVRLIVEREKEIEAFNITSAFKVTGTFELSSNTKYAVKAEVTQKIIEKKNALEFLTKCKNSTFTVSNVETKPSKKSPPPPFTTSTLQQEASRKLGFSVSKTMLVAQQLYESGNITYMRTDSVNLSTLALDTAKHEITSFFGSKYVHTRNFITKTKGAQEAHEAIRPTYIQNHNIDGDNSQKRLYDLIWKRTIASQMSDAEIEKTSITIDVSKATEKFVAKGEVIKFDGFLKVYIESNDDENSEEEQKGILPPLKTGEILDRKNIEAVERFTLHPPRYTEASLVKKLEELGIGRPSTYAPIISTIQKRGYVLNEERQGTSRNFVQLVLVNNNIKEEIKSEVYGYEKSKLFPTDIGNLVNQFLVQYFNNIIDYNFTASVEKEFDEIAEGKKPWNKMIKEFYEPFHLQVLETTKVAEKFSGVRLLGIDKVSGKNVYVKIARFGPVAQIGDTEDEEKPRFAGLQKGQSIDTITLDQVMDLFKLPREVGTFEDIIMSVAIGRFGPYIKHNNQFFSLGKTDDPYTISEKRSIEIILEKRDKDSKKLIREFNENAEVKVLNGRWGAYIAIGKNNYKIPKGLVPESLTLNDCLKIADETKPSGSTANKGKSFVKKVTPKKKVAKKVVKKKK